MDRIFDFQMEIAIDSALTEMHNAFDMCIAEEASYQNAGTVVSNMTEYDRLMASGLMAKVDDLGDTVKDLKRQMKKTKSVNTDDIDKIISDLKGIRTEILKLDSDPKSFKKSTRSNQILYIVISAVVGIIFAFAVAAGAAIGASAGSLMAGAPFMIIGGAGSVATISSAIHEIKNLKWIDAKKATIKMIDALIKTCENIKAKTNAAQ